MTYSFWVLYIYHIQVQSAYYHMYRGKHISLNSGLGLFLVVNSNYIKVPNQLTSSLLESELKYLDTKSEILSTLII